ncbi:MAG: 30S ribosomal protein S6 [Myxococcota bacterium]
MSKTLGKTREYETVLIINPDLADDAVGDLVGRFLTVLEKTGATFLREDRWGKRKMAFDMRKNPRGHYIMLHFVGQQASVAEIQRLAHNLDGVIRFLTEVKGPVTDIEAKKADVERIAREKSAEKARLEAEKAEAERAAAAAAEEGGSEDESAAQA